MLVLGQRDDKLVVRRLCRRRVHGVRRDVRVHASDRVRRLDEYYGRGIFRGRSALAGADVRAHDGSAVAGADVAAVAGADHDDAADRDAGHLRVRARRADENNYAGREITNIRLPACLQPVGLTSSLYSNPLIANY